VLTVPPLTIRPIAPPDSIDELTALLHRSYAVYGAMRLNCTAIDQTTDVTRAWIARGRCFLAVDATARVIGTIVYFPPARIGGSPWFERPDVAKFGQLAVDPAFQRRGAGTRLVETAEAEARAAGAKEIALDTVEPVTQLVEWYGRRGYRFIEHAQWPGKCYRSAILSKTL
jgi:GNAT superfamily N-acetyltransferase